MYTLAPVTHKGFCSICFSATLCYHAPMLEHWIAYSLPALFLVSFGASTLLPLGSEWLLIALLLQGEAALPSVGIATLGNTLGAATNYLIGYLGSDWLTTRLLRISPKQRLRATGWYQRYGSWSLLFSWLPLVGDPLCLISGSLKTSLLRFFLLVVIGKGLRYSAVAFFTLKGSQLF